MSLAPTGTDLIQLVREMLVIMDPGRDQDDEDTLVAANRAIRLGILEVAGVIANLKPSKRRARLARGTLQALGNNAIPVGFGSGHDGTDSDGFAYEFRAGYLADECEIVDGEALILKTLERAADHGIILTLLSQLTDAASALRDHPDLFRRKIRRIVIMGGVITDGNHPKLDANGYLLPDLTAQNHAFDKEAATFLYAEAQRRHIPLTILSRHAAAQAKVPRMMYDEMAATGHPIGIQLRNAQKAAIEELWLRAVRNTDDPLRHGLPARCGRAWFLKTFCTPGADPAPGEAIWESINGFLMYDPCTLIAAMPGLREKYFSPYVHEAGAAENFIIGLSADRHGVADPAGLAQYLHRALVESLALSQAERLAV